MRPLDRKLVRDLRRWRSQFAAIALVVASGVALFVALRSMHGYLREALASYYAQHRFAHVFTRLERAPLAAAGRLAAVPGVAALETRVVADVLLDVPGLAEPATGRMVSLREDGLASLNALYLRSGRAAAPGRRDEVVVSDAFARANRLQLGDELGAAIGGRWQPLRIVGTAISPEYVYEIRGATEIFPDNRRFGVVWMGRSALAAAFDLDGAFNDVVALLAPGSREQAVLDEFDRLLAPHGGLGAYGRDDHVSHLFVIGEIEETRVTSLLVPAIFLAVTAFLLHIVMQRLVATQREQIAVLKAFGYPGAAVGLHYLKLASVPVVAGSAAGVAFGVWFASELAAVYARFYQFPAARFQVDWWVAAAGVAVGGGAALLGAGAAVQRVLRLPPAEAMRPEAPAAYRAGRLERVLLQRLLTPAGRIVARQLRRRPFRTVFSVLGVALAVAILVTGGYLFDAVQALRSVQFDAVAREDLAVAFRTPLPSAVEQALAGLPGVLRVETFRAAPARLRAGHRTQRVTLMGVDPAVELRRIVDHRRRAHVPPPDGLLLSAQLAGMLEVRAGDSVRVEILEGRRIAASLPVRGTVDELVGTAAYMDRRALHRLLREGRAASGAFLAVDPARQSALYATLKRLPAISGVGARDAALRGFDRTIAESFRISITVILGFACVIAFGMVYNSARVALSERSRELASLRVLGFSRGEVAAMLLGEQALLTALAVPAGWLLGAGLCQLIVLRFSSELFRLPLVLSRETLFFAAAVTAGAAALSALAVRRRLDRLDLTEALKVRD